jgi:hypothetical protein
MQLTESHAQAEDFLYRIEDLIDVDDLPEEWVQAVRGVMSSSD